MMRCALLLRLLLSLWLGWSGAETSFGAEASSSSAPAVIGQAEEENPPPAKPPTKRPRRKTRPARKTHTEPATVEVGRDVVVAADETVPGLVVIAGNAKVDGTVHGSLVVISGSATVNGQVDEDLVTILGPATLGPQAHIGNDTVVVGGPFKASRQAVVEGKRTVVALSQVLPNMMWLQGWLAKGALLARPFPPQVRWVWLLAGLFLALYLLMTVLFPRSVRACVNAVEHRPMASFFVGMLLLALLLPVMVLLACSVIGIPAIPVVICAFLIASLFGKVGVFSYAGQQVGRQIHMPNASLPIILLLGTILFYLIYMVPVLGFLVWGIASLLGLGAAYLAATGSLRRTPPPGLAGPAPGGPVNMNLGAAQGASMPGAGGVGLAVAVPPLLSTSEAVLLQRAGFWRRLTATFLDFVLLFMAIHFTGPLFLIVWAAYHVGMWTWKATTIGGIVMSIKIVRLDGQPMTFAVAFVRSLSSFFSAFALFLGFFWAGWDRERQSWHDKIAGTTIVRVPKGISLL